MPHLSPLQVIETLVFSGLGENLSPNELESLSQLFSELELDPGELLIDDGTQSEHLYIIASGSIEVQFFLSYEGAFQEICRLRRGAIVGEMAMLESDVHSARTVARERSTVLTVNNQDFLAHLKANPSVGFQVMFNLGRLLSKRLRFTNQAIRHQLTK